MRQWLVPALTLALSTSTAVRASEEMVTRTQPAEAVTQSPWAWLPAEIQEMVFRELRFVDLKSAAAVCRAFAELARSRRLGFSLQVGPRPALRPTHSSLPGKSEGESYALLPNELVGRLTSLQVRGAASASAVLELISRVHDSGAVVRDLRGHEIAPAVLDPRREKEDEQILNEMWLYLVDRKLASFLPKKNQNVKHWYKPGWRQFAHTMLVQLAVAQASYLRFARNIAKETAKSLGGEDAVCWVRYQESAWSQAVDQFKDMSLNHAVEKDWWNRAVREFIETHGFWRKDKYDALYHSSYRGAEKWLAACRREGVEPSASEIGERTWLEVEKRHRIQLMFDMVQGEIMVHSPFRDATSRMGDKGNNWSQEDFIAFVTWWQEVLTPIQRVALGLGDYNGASSRGFDWIVEAHRDAPDHYQFGITRRLTI